MAAPKRVKRTEAAQERWFSGKVDNAGRVLIPAELRERLGLTPGARLTLRTSADGAVEVRSQAAAVRAGQAYFRQFRKPGELLSEELIRERHAQAAREYGE
ncbi:MAG: AbrB/MazE/SpoVT family DNA-binding domain-containing protein [Terriglobales bacterium]